MLQTVTIMFLLEAIQSHSTIFRYLLPDMSSVSLLPISQSALTHALEGGHVTYFSIQIPINGDIHAQQESDISFFYLKY